MPANDPPGCLSAILRLFGSVPVAEAETAEFPYQREDSLLTEAERSFFGVLQQVAGAQFLIFAKVRLADLVSVRRGAKSWQSHFSRIKSKHIDFVLCDPQAVRPILAIELDDSSHGRSDRRARDDFVDAALAAAGLPLLRVVASSQYNAGELAREIQDKIGG